MKDIPKHSLESSADIQDRSADARDFLQFLQERGDDFSAEEKRQIIENSHSTLRKLRGAEDAEYAAWYGWHDAVDPRVNPFSSEEWDGAEPEHAQSMRATDRRLSRLGNALGATILESIVTQCTDVDAFKKQLARGERSKERPFNLALDLLHDYQRYGSKYKGHIRSGSETFSSPDPQRALFKIKEVWRVQQPEYIAERQEALALQAWQTVENMNKLHRRFDTLVDEDEWLPYAQRVQARLLQAEETHKEQTEQAVQLIHDGVRLFRYIRQDTGKAPAMVAAMREAEKSNLLMREKLKSDAQPFEEHEAINDAVTQLRELEPRIDEALLFLKNNAETVTAEQEGDFLDVRFISSDYLQAIIQDIYNPPRQFDPRLF